MDGVYFGFVLFLLLLVFASILSRTLVDDEVAKRLAADRQASLRSAVAWTVVAAVCLVPSLAAIIVFVAGGGLAAGGRHAQSARVTATGTGLRMISSTGEVFCTYSHRASSCSRGAGLPTR